VDPLWLENPLDSMGKPLGRGDAVGEVKDFQENKLITRKFKPRPTTQVLCLRSSMRPACLQYSTVGGSSRLSA
jgi:hypothetical protein